MLFLGFSNKSQITRNKFQINKYKKNKKILRFSFSYLIYLVIVFWILDFGFLSNLFGSCYLFLGFFKQISNNLILPKR
jgi:hypothetical protein